MKSILFTGIVLLTLVGCGSDTAATANAPREGSMKMDNLSADEKIQKVQNSNEIPEQYKQTYINSVQSQGQSSPPAGQ